MIALKKWWPEVLLVGVAGFFYLRELGTFPAAWTDDSLFMIIAREIAAGRGYQLPILENPWPYPYILAVGPTLLLPVAWSIQLFGFSVAIARIPMVLYMTATTVLLYVFTKKISNRPTAVLATILLVSLSAFVNTGKVVMGEVPSFFYLLLGLLCLLYVKTGWKRDVLAGLCFGLSVLTKLTLGLIYPAIGVVWLAAVWKKDVRSLISATITGVVACAIYIPWRLLEAMSSSGLSKDFAFMFSGEDSGGLQLLHGHAEILLRPQFLYYEGMFVLGCIGLWAMRRKLQRDVWLLVTTLILLCTAYFLSSFGWYRHLLLAHVLLLPFVVIAIQGFFNRKITILIICSLVLGQGWWQLTYKGSSRSTVGAAAATYIEQHYNDTPMIVQQAEVYVRLPKNPHWLFLTNPILTSRLPAQFVTLSDAQRCMYWFKVLSAEETAEYADRIVELVVGKYAVVAPPAACAN